MAVANTLAYYNKTTITAVKRFIVLAQPLQPYSQTLDQTGKVCQGLTIQLIASIAKLRPQKVFSKLGAAVCYQHLICVKCPLSAHYVMGLFHPVNSLLVNINQ